MKAPWQALAWFLPAAACGFWLARRFQLPMEAPAAGLALAPPTQAAHGKTEDPALVLALVLQEQTDPGDRLVKLARILGNTALEECSRTWAQENPTEFAAWLKSPASARLASDRWWICSDILFSSWAKTEPALAWKTLTELPYPADAIPDLKNWTKSALVSTLVAEAPGQLLALPQAELAGVNFSWKNQAPPTDGHLTALRDLPEGRMRDEYFRSLVSVWKSHLSTPAEELRFLGWWRGLPEADRLRLDLNDMTGVLTRLEPAEFGELQANTKYARFELEYWLRGRLGTANPAERQALRTEFSPAVYQEALAGAVNQAVEDNHWDTAVSLAGEMGSAAKQRTQVLDALKDKLTAPEFAAWLQKPGTPPDWKQAGFESVALTWLAAEPEKVPAWCAQAPREWLTKDFLSFISGALGEQDTDAWLKWTESMADHPDTDSAIAASLREMARRNGPRAMSLIQSLPPAAQAAAVQDVAETWRRYDSQGMTAWLQNQPADVQNRVAGTPKKPEQPLDRTTK